MPWHLGLHHPVYPEVFCSGVCCPRSGWTLCCRLRPGAGWGAWTPALQVHRHVHRQGEDLVQRDHPLQGQGIQDVTNKKSADLLLRAQQRVLLRTARGQWWQPRRRMCMQSPELLATSLPLQRCWQEQAKSFAGRSWGAWLTLRSVRSWRQSWAVSLQASRSSLPINGVRRVARFVLNSKFKIQESIPPDWWSTLDGGYLSPWLEKGAHWGA